MCYRPLHIRNNSASYSRDLPLYNNVPCGQCEDCLDVRRMDWFSRAYAEFKGSCFGDLHVVYTLTYDDAHLPHAYGRKCFSRDVVQRFIKRLRDYLSRHHPNASFSYLLCSEFGDLFARSHHHVYFHVRHIFSAREFYKAVLATWQNGFIHYSSGSLYGSILSVKALRYVTKYITKDLQFNYHFFKFRSLMEYARLYKSYIDDPLEDYSECPQTAKEFKQFMHNSPDKQSLPYVIWQLWHKFYLSITPFSTCSQGFGEYALQLLSSKNISDGTITLPHGNYGMSSVPLPRYLERKLYYNRVFNPRTLKKDLYRLNELGLNHKISQLPKRIDELSQNIFETFRSMSSSHVSDPSIFKNLPSHLQNIISCSDYCLNLPYTTKQLAIYILVYRYLPIELDLEHLFDESYYLDVYSSTLLATYDDTHESLSETSSFNRSQYKNDLLRNHLLLLDLETAATIYNNYTSYVRKTAADVRMEKKDIQRKIKQLQKLKDYEKRKLENHS